MRYFGVVRLVVAVLLVTSSAACAGDGTERSSQASPSAPSATLAATTGVAERDKPGRNGAVRASGEMCRFIATTVEEELRKWADAQDVTSAPVAESRLGPQPDEGVPGVLVDGCVWEVRGSTGGHIGVAVERFTDADMAAIMAMGRDAGVEPSTPAGGPQSWYVSPSGGTPSGAVIVGDRTNLVVVRVESYSETSGGAFLGDDGRADRFFREVGDAVRQAHPG